MSSSFGETIVYLASGFLLGIWLIYCGVKQYLLVQKIRNIPTSSVEGAAVGLIELSGKARCHDPALSPISKVKSAYWEVVGEYYYSAGKYSHWEHLWSRESSRLFYLEDKTGKMLVDSKGCDIDIPYDKLYEGYISDKGNWVRKPPPLPTEVLDFINGLDPAGKAAFMAHPHENIRIFESYIADGDQLYVMGSAEPQAGASSSVGHENLIVKKGAYDTLLYISDSGERKVIANLSNGIYWCIGGLALSAVCLLIFLQYIGVK
jgi:hypothetical protein